jgi:peptidoglycan/xylan/chitin deacetylase (PgdA/CDA1 family)
MHVSPMTKTFTIAALVALSIGVPVSRTHGSSGRASVVRPCDSACLAKRAAAAPRAAVVQPHAGGPKRPTIRMAITLDDLPGGGPEVAGYTHARILRDIIAILKAHHVSHAVGFVVGSMLENQPERRAALADWVQAGFEVGNHTYSHDTLAELGVDGYIKDILKNRPVVDALEQRTRQRHKYFRYPYLEEGRTENERKALRRFLHEQHYTVARVSVRFSDTDWADPYLRCLQKGDEASLETLGQTYLENAAAYLAWSVAAAREVFGHAIPQVLLLHPTVAAAKNLDAVLSAYEHAGVRYISLEEALAEPAYTGHYDVSGDNLISRASRSLGRPRPPDLVEPAALLDLVCR